MKTITEMLEEYYNGEEIEISTLIEGRHSSADILSMDNENLQGNTVTLDEPEDINANPEEERLEKEMGVLDFKKMKLEDLKVRLQTTKNSINKHKEDYNHQRTSMSYREVIDLIRSLTANGIEYINTIKLLTKCINDYENNPNATTLAALKRCPVSPIEDEHSRSIRPSADFYDAF